MKTTSAASTGDAIIVGFAMNADPCVVKVSDVSRNHHGHGISSAGATLVVVLDVG